MRTAIYMGLNNPITYKRGVENVIEIQAKALGPGTSKVYLFFDDETSIFRWNDILCIGIRKGFARFFRLNVVVLKILRKAKAKKDTPIIHSHNYLMSCFLLRRTDLFTVHDGLWYLKKCFKSRFPWLFWAIERIVYQRADRVHCNSHFTYATSQLPNIHRDASVIYCSTPLEHCKAANTTYRASAPGRRISFSVRSIEPRARIDLILEMALLAQRQSLKIDFVVAGKGPLLTHYRQIIQEWKLANIQLIGFIPDSELAARYRDCDCVLVTCENGEGFGLPIIEGYLFGKPVVASKKCAIPEVILDLRYLSVNDAATMLETLERTFGEQDSAARFRDHYNRNFANDVIVKEFSELYEEIFISVQMASARKKRRSQNIASV